MRTTFRLALVVVAAAAVASPAAAVTGEMRTLYLLATWGPVPFSNEDLERVGAETDAYFRTSSSGRFAMPAAVAGPITLRRDVFDACDATALRNAAPAAIFSGYARIVFVTPIVGSCPFFGEANPTEVLLNGRLFRNLAAHELGHTLGLGHASRWVCGVSGGGCTVDEYGSAFSVMGGGSGDFNAFEKWRLEWLTGLVRAAGNGVHELGPIEGPTALPQALVVRTAASEFWFESRGLSTPSFNGGSEQPAGMTALAGPAPGGELSPYSRDNLLLANPAGGARYAYAAGEAFVRPGVFRVALERHSFERATLRFDWLDRVPPSRPRLRLRSRRPGRIGVSWTASRERGSGLESFTVLLDGRPVRTVRQEVPFTLWTEVLRAGRGRHRVGVYATDRAGNRSAVATARVRVR